MGSKGEQVSTQREQASVPFLVQSLRLWEPAVVYLAISTTFSLNNSLDQDVKSEGNPRSKIRLRKLRPLTGADIAQRRCSGVVGRGNQDR